MSEELFDLEIKKSFDEEFDAQDIFVSEDLIAKTMAAIKSIDKDTTENDNTPESTEAADKIVNIGSTVSNNVTNISNPSAKKKSYKWVSGIAAAVVIGVIGLVIFKLGGGIKKSSDYAAYEGPTANSTSDNSYYDKVMTESVAETQPKTEASGGQSDMSYAIPDEAPCEVTEAAESDRQYMNSTTTNDLTGDLKTADSALPEASDADKDDGTKYEDASDDNTKVSTGDSATGDGGSIVINPDNEDVGFNLTGIGTEGKNPETIILTDIEQIVAELGMTEDKEMLPDEENMEKLRNTEGYLRLKSYGDDAKIIMKEIYEKCKTADADSYAEYAPLAPMMNVMYLILNDTAETE